MITHPTSDELLAAVIGLIERISPNLQDRDVFLARVAVNALGVVRRELLASPSASGAASKRLTVLLDQPGDFQSLNTALCAAIQAGRFDEDDVALMAHLKASAVDQVRIDQPSYSGLKAAQITD